MSWPPDLKMSRSGLRNMEGYQNSDPANGHQVKCPIEFSSRSQSGGEPKTETRCYNINRESPTMTQILGFTNSASNYVNHIKKYIVLSTLIFHIKAKQKKHRSPELQK